MAWLVPAGGRRRSGRPRHEDQKRCSWAMCPRRAQHQRPARHHRRRSRPRRRRSPAGAEPRRNHPAAASGHTRRAFSGPSPSVCRFIRRLIARAARKIPNTNDTSEAPRAMAAGEHGHVADVVPVEPDMRGKQGDDPVPTPMSEGGEERRGGKKKNGSISRKRTARARSASPQNQIVARPLLTPGVARSRATRCGSAMALPSSAARMIPATAVSRVGFRFPVPRSRRELGEFVGAQIADQLGQGHLAVSPQTPPRGLLHRARRVLLAPSPSARVGKPSSCPCVGVRAGRAGPSG